MRNYKKVGVLSVTLALALTVPVLAKGPGGGHGPGGGPVGGGGRFGGRSPIVSGTVTAINATANTLTVQTGGTTGTAATSVTLNVPSMLSITRFSTTGIAGLTAGDKIEVRGLPLVIQASSIRAASAVATTGGTTGSTTGGTTTGTTTGTTETPHAQADAVAVGTVQSVDATKNQIALTLADGTAVTVNAAAGLQVERQDTVTLAAAQVGDAVFARVSIDTVGNVTALALQLKAATAATTTTTGSATTGTSG